MQAHHLRSTAGAKSAIVEHIDDQRELPPQSVKGAIVAALCHVRLNGATSQSGESFNMGRTSAGSELCGYDTKRIFIRDKNLCDELIGHVSFTQFLVFLTLGRTATAAEIAIVDAAMVALAEHGMTPSTIAARLTYLGAPESLQGAVAAGLLGVGDQFVGTVEQVAPLLKELLEHPDGVDAGAAAIVERYKQANSLIPGFGQPHHKPDDPRSPALFAVAERVGVEGHYIRAIKILGLHVDRALGRHFTINAPGAIAALFLEIGVPMEIMRGFVIVSRCAGMIGHLREEQLRPVGRALWAAGDKSVPYVGPSPVGAPSGTGD